MVGVAVDAPNIYGDNASIRAEAGSATARNAIRTVILNNAYAHSYATSYAFINGVTVSADWNSITVEKSANVADVFSGYASLSFDSDDRKRCTGKHNLI